MTAALLFLGLSLTAARGPAPQEVLLWPGGAPGAKGNEAADRPTLTAYRAPAGRATGAAVVAYPVITLKEPHVHRGSRDNLLGRNPPPELVEKLSNETQVTARTPPTFLFHTDADTVVVPENSVLFYAALRKARVPAELHV